MSKPRAIRDRKSEMTSCWVCALFVAIIFIAKNALIGFDTMGMFNWILIVLFGIWVGISVYYTVQYKRWKNKNNM